MSVINSTTAATAAIFASQARQSSQTSESFAQVLASVEAESSSSSTSNSLRGQPAGIGTYNSCGKLTRGGPDELLAAVRQANDDGQEISPELAAKLSGSNPEAFMEALGEITGQTPAQVMTSLLNMNSTQAAALASRLAELTGGEASTFTPMLSKLTGHAEDLIEQCFNNEEDEDESGVSDNEKKSAALDGLKYQRDFNSVSFPSIDVTV